MLIRRPPDIRSSDITSESVYLNRRAFIKAAGAIGAALAAPALLSAIPTHHAPRTGQGTERPNSFDDITSYNNYYEFGTGKDDPGHNAGGFVTRPWSVEIAGEVAR